MSNKRIIDLDDSVQLDIDDYVMLYNSEPTADYYTYKSKLSDVLSLQTISVNGKTGNTITIVTDDIGDTTSTKKFVSSTEKSKIALIRTDLGGSVFLAGDGTYKTMGSYSGGTTVIVVSENTTISSLNQNSLVIVDTTSSPITITLPTTPLDKQNVRIKDGGNAYSNNITIDGNGKLIEDSAQAHVDSSFGACEVIYIELLDKWVVVSFVV